MLLAPLLLLSAQDPGRVTVRKDDTEIRESCRVAVAKPVLEDRGEEGVIRITGSGITVDLEGAALHGAPPGTRPDRFDGVGILVLGADVTLRNARVSGYRCGILARGAHGLVLEDCDVSNNLRQHLGSTPAKEDPADWLRPHENDQNEWLRSYGAGIWLEEVMDPTVRRCRGRNGQNGLVLDRVIRARVYDNDFSFLSGWGLALWRSHQSTVTRNALDFCIRGYSHGVYNRGQDSAGILCFEQCSQNVFAENSATHGGDGFFGFAGSEAFGDKPPPSELFGYQRRGCNDNLLLRNDFSYAAAHGIEMTFSFGNRFLENRLVGNAICGIWGGYSQDTLIAGNTIAENGEAGYGLERGGINIEHSKGNWILGNSFQRNRCGVHIWWDPDEHFAGKPWIEANDPVVADNYVVNNTFAGDEVALHLRDCPGGVFHHGNRMEDVGRPLEATEGSEAIPVESLPERGRTEPDLVILGETRPVGARPRLRGREKILMTEWGPYDWEQPLLHLFEDRGGEQVWRVLGVKAEVRPRVEGQGVRAESEWSGPNQLVTVSPRSGGGILPYRLVVEAGEARLEGEGLLVAAEWTVRVFPWRTDPREDEDTWRREARQGVEFRAPRLDLRYAMGGPGQLDLPEAIREAGLPADRFGTLAETVLRMPAGRWRLTTLSDDGVRVRADGEVLIENWTWHGPTEDSAVLELKRPRTVRLQVEHFELDGYAVLSLEIGPAGD